jgi:integrase
VATIDRRKTKEGENRWRVRVRRRGITETASFSSRTEADQWAAEVEQAIDSGLWSDVDSVGGLTVGWILDRYMAHKHPNRDTRSQLEWWRRHLGSGAATSVSRRKILSLRRALANEELRSGRTRSPATVNRYMAALSGMLSWALKSDHLAVHPMKGIEPLAEASTRSRCLSGEERQALIVASREAGGLRLETLVVLALSTGATRGELLRLCWSDLNVDQRQVVIHGTGRLRTRTLAVPEPAFKLLGQLSRVRRIDRQEIFSEPDGRVRFPRAAWRSALASAGIENCRFHDLRHSAASYLAQSGASLPEIAEILGTRTLEGVQRYSHLTESRPPTALGRMHEDLFEA